MNHERRRLNRFSVNENAFVTVGARDPRLGKIRDISRNGLSFEYYADHSECKMRKIASGGKVLQANIFVASNGFFLSDVPCVIAYDIVEYVMTSSLKVKKRCGIHFGKCTDDQVRLLTDFLKRQTTGLAH